MEKKLKDNNMTTTKWYLLLLIIICFVILFFVVGIVGKSQKKILEISEEPPSVIEIVKDNSKKIDLYTKYIREHNYKVFPELAELIATGIIDTGEKFEMPSEFLLALSQVESSFNYFVISNADCIGLLQINPKVWVQDKENPHNLIKAGILKQTIDLYDPVINLHAGAYIFKHYYKQGLQKNVSNPLKYTLTKYFGGETNDHFLKFTTALGEFLMFKYSVNKENALQHAPGR